MISEKILQGEVPLNPINKLTIKDVILQEKRYISQTIDDELMSRNVDMDSQEEKTEFNFVMDDFEEKQTIIKENTQDTLIKLLLCCTDYSGSSDNEDIDTLLKQIRGELTSFEQEIQKIRARKDVLLANVPTIDKKTGVTYGFDEHETQFISEIDAFLEKYKGYKF